jgi:hypothetical protein
MQALLAWLLMSHALNWNKFKSSSVEARFSIFRPTLRTIVFDRARRTAIGADSKSANKRNHRKCRWRTSFLSQSVRI